jgi:molybdopterin converting factor subunit 1
MTGIGKVRVRLFARLADVAGTRTTEVDLGEGLTAGDAYRLLCREHPDMEGLEGSLMYAVNAEYVRAEHPLKDGDELALIPPVSGGSCARNSN